MTSPSLAATATVKDGATLQLANNTFRLDGIDAPAVDQMCIDEHADSWACGVEARDQLAKLVAGKQVRCGDLGPDPSTKKHRIGLCIVEGETVGLGQLMVQKGLALADARGKFKADELAAKNDRRGLWRGCFAAPADFSLWKKDAALVGGACRADRDQQIRAVLFSADPVMPAGCAIKGKYAVRARVTGNVGIYHLQACRSYPGLTNSERWFCSEDDAQAAGFRKAYNCGGKAK
ncbi:thermonuclease family protein [Bradyrhizobium sp.]|uniref:thermonuclease family protein n=1 Tax=Bradyrhizobium sp. TaxID=376 RepID=UPI0025BBE425|nr:thermonuclease family protein [Bradyrhizobium sp.]